MLITLSPAKTLNFDPQQLTCEHSTPRLLKQSRVIIKEIKQYTADEIGALMGVSDELAKLNHQRFKVWKTPFTPQTAKQAILAFQGQAYDGLDAENWSTSDFTASQDYLRILSGLYGILRPLDLMQAYRLEMGTRMAIGADKNLYAFWGSRLTTQLNADLKETGSETLVNLASNEYFKAVQHKDIHARIVTPSFKEERDGGYKMISFFAKVARGQMTSYIIKNRLTCPEQIKDFNTDGYRYNKHLSTDDQWTFTRKSA